MASLRTVQLVGCHAEGEVGDVIVGGVLPPPGATMFQKMQALQRDGDALRRMLICEPRGSVARHVNLLLPPTRADCDIGLIIMEPTEYPPMSGSNLICAVTVALETGVVSMREPETVVTVDTPAGPVRAIAACRAGKCLSVAVQNVPAFVNRLDVAIEVAGAGSVTVDIAYGGMFYAMTDVTKLGYALVPEEARALAELGERIRLACRAQLDVRHPGNPAISGVSIVQLQRPFAGVGQATRNTCIIAPGRSDRSPTGTGTCARMAVLHARGLMKDGDSFVHESIIGSRFTGRIAGLTVVAGRPAILPEITGRGWITGHHTYVVDPSDPYPAGYVVADTWGVTPGLTQSG